MINYRASRFPSLEHDKPAFTGKALYRCSKVPTHRVTTATASNNSWMCPHCGAELAARKNKVEELHSLAAQLGYKICNYEKDD